MDYGFKYASELKLGDRVLSQNGSIYIVQKNQKEQLEEPVKVYNFEVEDWHTYCVSEYGVIVHNLCDGETVDSGSGTDSSGTNVGKGGSELGNKRLYRVMSEAELDAVKNTGMLRGGREGTTFFTDSYY